ncbi:hypothetical protein J6590_104905 [Homalodisca vitripennis]|nr:hypothetical protein J6590_104905 [Homalodisca vitripennis]
MNYSQIDREALAVVHGVRTFHQYLYGLLQSGVVCKRHIDQVIAVDNPPILAADKDVAAWWPYQGHTRIPAQAALLML